VALESKLEAREKEVQQLTRALEKTDEHISGLENELAMYRCQCVASSAAPSTDNEHDAVLNTALTSSHGSICHHPPTGDNTQSDSCRKKLKFTMDGCN